MDLSELDALKELIRPQDNEVMVRDALSTLFQCLGKDVQMEDAGFNKELNEAASSLLPGYVS